MLRGRKGVTSRRTKKSGTNDSGLAAKRNASAVAAAAAALIAPKPLQEPLQEPPPLSDAQDAELELPVREPVCRNAQEEKLRRAAIDGRAQHLSLAQRADRVHLPTHLRHGARRRWQREGAARLPRLPPQCRTKPHWRPARPRVACSARPGPHAATAVPPPLCRHRCPAVQGYLVRMSPCIDSSTGALELRKGDELAIDGRYFVGSNDPRLLYSDGTHLNVMR